MKPALFHSAARGLRRKTYSTLTGRHGRLSLIVTSYRPSVRCSRPVAEGQEPDDCDEILLSMPASKGFQQFGPNVDPRAGTELPVELANGKFLSVWQSTVCQVFCLLLGFVS